MSTPFDADSATHLVQQHRRVHAEGRVGRSHQRAVASASRALPAADHPVDRHGDAGRSGAGARRDRVRLSRAMSTRKPAAARFRETVARSREPGRSCAARSRSCIARPNIRPIAHSINLRAMATLRNAFGLPVGFSDHSRGIHVASAAVALGATVIEKHLTLDRILPGPDHRASIEPDELAAMIASIRDVEARARRRPQGSGRGGDRQPHCGAQKPRRNHAASAAASAFSEDNLGVKRPGGGVPPIEYWSLSRQEGAVATTPPTRRWTHEFDCSLCRRSRPRCHRSVAEPRRTVRSQ